MYRFSARAGGVPTLIIFFRGHWCPYCRRYLSKVQSHRRAFEQRGVRIVAISPEPPANSRALASQLGIEFPILSDADGHVIEMFDVRNRFSAAQTLLPHAAVFIVGPDGDVHFRSVDRNFKKRTTMRAIAREIERLHCSAEHPLVPGA